MQTDPSPRAARADLALNLGILSLALPLVPVGLVAWALARRELALVRAGRADPAARGTLEAARIVALAGSALSLLVLGALVLAGLLAWSGYLAARALL